MRSPFSFWSVPCVPAVAAALLAGTHVLLPFLFAPDAQAQQLSGGFGEERPVSTVNEAYRASSVEVADVDGDGRQDIIGGSGDGKIFWYRNQGDGKFGEQQIISREPTPGTPVRLDRTVKIEVVDLGKDGDPDIISQTRNVIEPGEIASTPSEQLEGQNIIQVHENQGSGFSAPTTIAEIERDATTWADLEIAVGDLNSDGSHDLALSTDEFAGYLLREDGQFGPLNKVPVESTRQTGGIALTDVNGDGAPDLIVTENRAGSFGGDEPNPDINRISWRENQIKSGQEDFRKAITIQSLTANEGKFRDVATADINGDGSKDLVAVTEESGFFSQGKVISYTNQGGNFEPVVVDGGINGPSSVEVEDIGEDGSPDIVVGGASFPSSEGFDPDPLHIYENDGSGSFPEKKASLGGGSLQGGRIGDVAVGKVAGGQESDLVSASPPESKVAFHENQEDGFASPSVITQASRFGGSSQVRTADLDRDGTPDVAAIKSVGADSLFRYKNEKDPANRFENAQLISGGEIEILDDFIGINLGQSVTQDIFVQGSLPSKIYRIQNQGDGKFALPTPISEDISTDRLAKADLNGDGRKDLIAFGGDLVWYPNLGEGLGEKRVINETLFPDNIAVADINGDGRLDIAANTNSTAAATEVVWFKNKGGTFSEPKRIEAFPEESSITRAIAAGDIDGDGDEDIAVCFASGILWTENVGGTFSASASTLSASGQEASREDRSFPQSNWGGKETESKVRTENSGSPVREEESVWSRRPIARRAGFPSQLARNSTETIREGECSTIKIRDVNGDGREDIIHSDGRGGVGSGGRSAPLLFYSNLGGGRFGDPVPISNPLGGVEDFVLEDLNGDGRLDIYYSQNAPVPFAWAENQTIPPFVLGSPSGDSLVTAGDAALTRRIAVGLARPNFADSLAADVSGNGAINAGDASLIEQYVVGLIEEFPTKAPGGATEGEALASGRLGRPQPTGGAEGGSTAQPMNRVSGEIVWGEPEPVDSASGGASGEKEMMQVPIHLEDPQNVRAVQLELKYDPSSINVEDAEVGEVGGQEGEAEAKPWRAATNVQPDRGRIRMALSRVKPAKEGPVATLVVAVRERSPSGADAPETATLEGEAVLNDGTRQPLPETNVEPAPEALAVEPPSPNPFSQATTLRYALPERQRVRIELYDVLGRRARTALSREQSAGRHTVQIGGGGLPSGTYFYRLQAGSSVRSGKLTIVR